MRQTISGVLTAIAVVTAGAAPAIACGGGVFQGSCSPCGQTYVSPCAQPQVYVAPVAAPNYSTCDTGCGGWAYERLPDPVKQYYYVNQGPTYSGPGSFAPYPTYQESAVSGWDAYRRRPYYYGYDGGRYADAITHHYDGEGLDGPSVYHYSSHPKFRPWRMHKRYGYWNGRGDHYGYAPGPRHRTHHRLRYGALATPRHHDRHGTTLRRYY
jgi:hypothetical protein